MTHEEILNPFITLGLQQGDLVKITLNNDSEHIGELSSSQVYVDYNEKKEKINSRIG